MNYFQRMELGVWFWHTSLSLSLIYPISIYSYNALNPINFLEGPQIDPSYLQSITPFDTVGDFENYLKRLEDYPKQAGLQLHVCREYM